MAVCTKSFCVVGLSNMNYSFSDSPFSLYVAHRLTSQRQVYLYYVEVNTWYIVHNSDIPTTEYQREIEGKLITVK